MSGSGGGGGGSGGGEGDSQPVYAEVDGGTAAEAVSGANASWDPSSAAAVLDIYDPPVSTCSDAGKQQF